MFSFFLTVNLDNLEFISLINILMETNIQPVFNSKCMKMAENRVI